MQTLTTELLAVQLKTLSDRVRTAILYNHIQSPTRSRLKREKVNPAAPKEKKQGRQGRIKEVFIVSHFGVNLTTEDKRRTNSSEQPCEKN